MTGRIEGHSHIVCLDGKEFFEKLESVIKGHQNDGYHVDVQYVPFANVFTAYVTARRIEASE
jgi:hypothetical protein